VSNRDFERHCCQKYGVFIPFHFLSKFVHKGEIHVRVNLEKILYQVLTEQVEVAMQTFCPTMQNLTHAHRKVDGSYKMVNENSQDSYADVNRLK